MGREPIYLTVGTEVSAKYRGAFCEATVKEVKRLVKVRATLRDGKGSVTVTHDHLKLSSGTNLAVGKTVEVKGTDGQYTEAVVSKITDASVYTVVFDDGDEKSLRRTSLCLKGEKHFNESETLDHLPLTDPENFGTPVQPSSGKVKPRKRGHSGNSMSGEDGDGDEETRVGGRKRPRRNGDPCLGKVILVESSERRRTFWTPAVVLPSHSAPSGIDVAVDHVLARQFRDGKFVAVQRDGLRYFAKDADLAFRSETSVLGQKSALQQAMAYTETGELPWQPADSHEEGDSSDDDKGGSESLKSASPAQVEGCGDFPDDGPEVPTREQFQRKYFKFMEEQGSPVKTAPSVAGRSLDLYQLLILVRHHKGPDETIKQISLWREICSKLNLIPATSATAQSLKTAYEKYLSAFERSSWEGPGEDLGMEDDDEETALGEEEEQSLGEDGDEEEMQVDERSLKDISGPAVGDKIMVRYGRGRNQKHYAAKVVDIERDGADIHYFIHYAGWNNRYDEWISPDRIVEKGPGRGRTPAALRGKSRVRNSSKAGGSRATQQPSASRSGRRGDQNQKNSSPTMEAQEASSGTTRRPSTLGEEVTAGSRKELATPATCQPSPSPEPLVRTVPIGPRKQPVTSSSEEEVEYTGEASGEGTVRGSPDEEETTDIASTWQQDSEEEEHASRRMSRDMTTDETVFPPGGSGEDEKAQGDVSDDEQHEDGAEEEEVKEVSQKQMVSRTVENEIEVGEHGEADEMADEEVDHPDEAVEGSEGMKSDSEEGKKVCQEESSDRCDGSPATLADQAVGENKEGNEQEEASSVEAEEGSLKTEAEEIAGDDECLEVDEPTGTEDEGGKNGGESDADVVDSEEVGRMEGGTEQSAEEGPINDEEYTSGDACESEADSDVKSVTSREDSALPSKSMTSDHACLSSPESPVPSDEEEDELIEEPPDEMTVQEKMLGHVDSEQAENHSLDVNKSLPATRSFDESFQDQPPEVNLLATRETLCSSSEEESPDCLLKVQPQKSVCITEATPIVPKSVSGCSRYCHVQWVVDFTNSHLDTAERITVVQRKISDIRRVYSELRTELATIDRRLKRAKRRERERESENSCTQAGD